MPYWWSFIFESTTYSLIFLHWFELWCECTSMYLVCQLVGWLLIPCKVRKKDHQESPALTTQCSIDLFNLNGVSRRFRGNEGRDGSQLWHADWPAECWADAWCQLLESRNEMARSLQQCPAHPGFARSFVHLCSGKSGRIMVAFEGTRQGPFWKHQQVCDMHRNLTKARVWCWTGVVEYDKSIHSDAFLSFKMYIW